MEIRSGQTCTTVQTCLFVKPDFLRLCVHASATTKCTDDVFNFFISDIVVSDRLWWRLLHTTLESTYQPANSLTSRSACMPNHSVRVAVHAIETRLSVASWRNPTNSTAPTLKPMVRSSATRGTAKWLLLAKDIPDPRPLKDSGKPEAEEEGSLIGQLTTSYQACLASCRPPSPS